MGWLDLTSAGPELDESCTAECTPITIATCLSAGTAIPYSKCKFSTTAIMAVSQHNISANHYIQYLFSVNSIPTWTKYSTQSATCS